MAGVEIQNQLKNVGLISTKTPRNGAPNFVVYKLALLLRSARGSFFIKVEDNAEA